AVSNAVRVKSQGWLTQEIDENCEQSDVRVDRIRKRLTLRGALDETQRRRLLEIAERCPVNRTLTGSIKMEIELVPAGPV
ncbi:MAG TPA: hypothetical protein VGJ75_12260, partial [Dongiaceae bacterium]